MLFHYSISRFSFRGNKSGKCVDTNLAKKKQREKNRKQLILSRYAFKNLPKLVRPHLCLLRSNITNEKLKVSSFYFRNHCNEPKICYLKLFKIQEQLLYLNSIFLSISYFKAKIKPNKNKIENYQIIIIKTL